MKKIYIAGKVTGLTYSQAYNNFKKIEDQLQANGFQVVNPMNIVPKETTSWHEAMKICIKALMECDGIYLLSNWKESSGAKLESELASKLALNFITQKDLK
ncbi:DUF4406 domain-containing protein [Apibacter muscae]|uniref:DUF4406 domain-containing protein n=1 Tax=Apibacter muscae TaxID=2509004 RepID=UPI0011AB9823|nr:DUF4406 domain-containing protein [Apibacter muscae]TWP31908.1 DUF4406 domain-containing protein [Apibacter muscae]